MAGSHIQTTRPAPRKAAAKLGRAQPQPSSATTAPGATSRILQVAPKRHLRASHPFPKALKSTKDLPEDPLDRPGDAQTPSRLRFSRIWEANMGPCWHPTGTKICVCVENANMHLTLGFLSSNTDFVVSRTVYLRHKIHQKTALEPSASWSNTFSDSF